MFGTIFAIYSHYILMNTPLTALGLACVILGTTTALTPSSPVPVKTVRAIVEASCVNIEAVLEEFDAKIKATYLPPRDEESLGRAYVPLKSNPGTENASAAMDSPIRVVTNVGGEPGLLLFPPGSEIIRLSRLGDEAGIEDSLNYILVDFLEAVESVKATRDRENIFVSISGLRLSTNYPRFKKVLGELPTSIAGNVLASVTGNPVTLIKENTYRDEVRAVFKEQKR
jgi:hypothetical protein